jgi:hypothetical protein
MWETAKVIEHPAVERAAHDGRGALRWQTSFRGAGEAREPGIQPCLARIAIDSGLARCAGVPE